MARRFNGTSDYITFTLSSVLESLDAGPMTMAVLASVTSTTDGAFIHTRTSGGTNSWWMECSSAQWNYGQGVAARDIGDLTTSEGWAVYAGHKGNGGAAAPVGRKIILGGATTTVTAPSALADGTVPGAGGILQVGRWGTAAEYLGADIAACAVWDYELSDAEIDALITYAGWSATVSPPKWLVKFNQANATDAISDNTGNGGGSSAITGTTIVSDPAGFFGGGATVTATAVVGTAAVPAPTVSAGSTATPAAVAGVAAVPAPAVATGSRVTAAAVTGTAAVPAPTVTTGSRVSPAAVQGVTAVPAPAVSAGGSATVLPAAVAGVAAVPAPTLAAGSRVTAVAVAATAAVPAPAVAGGARVVAVAVGAVGAVPAPAVSTTGGATVAPASVVGRAAVPSPAVQTGGAVRIPVAVHVRSRPGGTHVRARPVTHVAA
jgi:hypothetical protein